MAARHGKNVNLTPHCVRRSSIGPAVRSELPGENRHSRFEPNGVSVGISHVRPGVLDESSRASGRTSVFFAAVSLTRQRKRHLLRHSASVGALRYAPGTLKKPRASVFHRCKFVARATSSQPSAAGEPPAHRVGEKERAGFHPLHTNHRKTAARSHAPISTPIPISISIQKKGSEAFP